MFLRDRQCRFYWPGWGISSVGMLPRPSGHLAFPGEGIQIFITYKFIQLICNLVLEYKPNLYKLGSCQLCMYT